jgi:hypothetical protein
VAYFDKPYSIENIVNHWLTLASKKYGSDIKGQNAKPITNVTGWLQYLAKHSTRSAEHYQRAPENIPEGWVNTGRMWGYTGDWKVSEPMKFLTCDNGHYAYRRICKKLKAASVRGRFLDARHALFLHAQRYPWLFPANRLESYYDSREGELLMFWKLKRKYFSTKSAFIYNRRHQKQPDKETSFYKGTSTWADEETNVRIMVFLSKSGYTVRQTD